MRRRYIDDSRHGFFSRSSDYNSFVIERLRNDFSADEKLGYVYVPLSAPPNDYYGGTRPGDDLFFDSLVALDAKTGKRVWHFQTVHHDLWDYDIPTPPMLADIKVNGRLRKAA